MINDEPGPDGSFGIPFTPASELLAGCVDLHRRGAYPAMGREQLYSGVTGAPLDGVSFVGCVFYQRLRHMVVFSDIPKKKWPITADGQNACTAQASREAEASGSLAASLGPVNQLVRLQ